MPTVDYSSLAILRQTLKAIARQGCCKVWDGYGPNTTCLDVMEQARAIPAEYRQAKARRQASGDLLCDRCRAQYALDFVQRAERVGKAAKRETGDDDTKEA